MSSLRTLTRTPRRAAAGIDRLGNPVPGYGDPVQVPVFAWFAGSPDGDGGASRAAASARTAITRSQVILAPPGTACTPGDLWQIDGQEFEQNGWAEDFSGGPFDDDFGGIRIHVTRKEG